jgi:hypothetical protein
MELVREIQEWIYLRSIKHAGCTAAHNQALFFLAIIRSALTARTNEFLFVGVLLFRIIINIDFSNLFFNSVYLLLDYLFLLILFTLFLSFFLESSTLLQLFPISFIFLSQILFRNLI